MMGGRSMGIWPRQMASVEQFFDDQRDQLPLWLPVAFGSGIAAWFALPGRNAWIAWMLVMIAMALSATMARPGSRTRRALIIAPVCAMMGCGLAWLRADQVAATVLLRPVVVTFTAKILDIDQQIAKSRIRMLVKPLNAPKLPEIVRVNVDLEDAPGDLVSGENVAIRARLVGPAGASVPGGFDFARVAWFQRLGGTGTALDPVVRIDPPLRKADGLRERLSRHVRSQIAGSAGGIAAAFASGDRGGIAASDEEAMRASGLTHLLSISGLHVTAVVGAAMFLTLRLLALSTRLALRLPLIVIAAGAGAAAGVGYTILTGAEVPTIRSCVAALLILIGLALGRQAFTLRLVATGALVVLLIWPEALVGPSFQLSFAAITSIVALHEWALMRTLVAPRDESMIAKLGRGLLSLLITGVVVEIALAPIALYHFHRQGLYGAIANIVAIPLTTFITMPAEALALLFDGVGWGAPFWWITGLSLELLLAIAHQVAALPGAVASLASVPLMAFAAIVSGGLWLLLWRGRVRAIGVVPMLAGALWALMLPPPDLLVTGDGMHLAVRGADGTLATLRPRAGDYIRSVLAERSGDLGELGDLDDLPGATCSLDSCRFGVTRAGRTWTVLATRSHYTLPWPQLIADCARADIVISDRFLPRGCTPKWLKADRAMLAKTGGLAITLTSGDVATVADEEGEHPWVTPR
jgi:competence protein ComEC